MEGLIKRVFNVVEFKKIGDLLGLEILKQLFHFQKKNGCITEIEEELIVRDYNYLQCYKYNFKLFCLSMSASS